MISDIDYENLYNWTKNYISNECIIKKDNMPGLKPGSTIKWVFYFKNGLYNQEFLSAHLTATGHLLRLNRALHPSLHHQ